MEKIKTVTQQHPKPNLFHVKIPDVQDSFPFWPFDPDFQGTKDLQNPSLVPVAMLLPRSSSSHSNHTEAQPAKPYRQFETTETTCPAVYLKDWSLEGPWIYRMCYVQCMCVTVCVCIYRVCACVWHIWLVEIMQLHHIVTSGEHSCSIGLIAGHNTFWLSFTRLGTLVYNFSIYFFGIFLSISPHPPLAPPSLSGTSSSSPQSSTTAPRSFSDTTCSPAPTKAPTQLANLLARASPGDQM